MEEDHNEFSSSLDYKSGKEKFKTRRQMKLTRSFSGRREDLIMLRKEAGSFSTLFIVAKGFSPGQ